MCTVHIGMAEGVSEVVMLVGEVEVKVRGSGAGDGRKVTPTESP